ncbi:S49 family peptidase [Pelagibacterium lentulum]|uniref:Peptidase S49 n=1 Tax=Pelagibacterium lentulum TaxID=2029865 RepID=A0A916VZM1_9HYPH|nr:S49 family peptidase [Pelagibacterium lentulum]GGA55862.1 peptidase S49 [Pelagibacterium lentulum]
MTAAPPTEIKDTPKRPWYKRLFRASGPTIPVVRLQGVISQDTKPGRLNIASVNPLLEKAFAFKKAPVVALIVNSPGGSAVQSHLIAKRIRQLADENKKQVLVFVEDAAASGGYFIATAGDEIIADPSSIVGSIGVIFSGFGFVDAIEKLGVTRRLYTAGKNKSTLDPFLPEKKEDVARIKQMELDVHDVFIGYVKARRAEKLKVADDELFTGEFWTAHRGYGMGLVDSLGDMHSTLSARYGKNVQVKLIAQKRGLFQLPRFGLSGSSIMEADLAGEVMAKLEDRTFWSRLGL